MDCLERMESLGGMGYQDYRVTQAMGRQKASLIPRERQGILDHLGLKVPQGDRAGMGYQGEQDLLGRQVTAGIQVVMV